MTSSDDIHAGSQVRATSVNRTVRHRGDDDPVSVTSHSLRGRLFVPSLVLVGSMMAIVSSLGAPLIPAIARTDGVSLSTAEWTLTITLMAGALATPVMGRLSDGPRQREVILCSLAVVVVGCVLSAISNGFVLLIVGRGFQGLGLGLVPVAMAIARRNLPPEKARRTIATLSITIALGAGIGYPATGLMAQLFDFHGAYWFGAVAVGATLVLVAFIVPSGPAVASRRFDTIGAVALTLIVIGVIVVLSEGEEWGWASDRSLGILVGCLILLVLWIPYELRSSDPLIELRQVRNRSVLTADVAGFLISVALYLLIPVVVEFIQIPATNGFGFGASVLVSGFVLVPMSVGTFAASRFLAVYEQRFGPRSMIPLGSAVVAVAAGFFALEHSALWEAFVVMGIIGLGIGFSSGAMPGFIVRAVPPSETGSATGFYSVLRSLGLAVGSALTAAVLAAHTRPGSSLADVQGFRMTLIIATGVCVATAVISYTLPERNPDRTRSMSLVEKEALDQMSEEEAEVAASGLTLGEEPSPLEEPFEGREGR
jgi:predicted MFS family arabinose efflux permease